jgi:ceramide glucosyltransferase
MIAWFDDVAVLLAVVGLLQCVAGLVVVRRFVKRAAAVAHDLPPISVLRPLCGDEPELEAALTSCFSQDYPRFEIIFGVARADDPAIAVAEKVRALFPDRVSALIVDPALHGTNRKVSNLINMLPLAQDDLLLICDSDLHLAPDYLRKLVAEMQKPAMGLVTALYTGLPCDRGVFSRLGATQISHQFLPSVLLSRAFGREDCLGSTTMLHRETLAAIGGLEALASTLAEDNLMGQRVRALGLHVGVADTIAAAMVPEANFRALWQHEIRWSRTIASIEPLGLAATLLQYPLFWALVALALTPLLPDRTNAQLVVLALVWLVRSATVNAIDRALQDHVGREAPPVGAWLLPIRDVLSVIEVVVSFGGKNVLWRGFKMTA